MGELDRRLEDIIRQRNQAHIDAAQREREAKINAAREAAEEKIYQKEYEKRSKKFNEQYVKPVKGLVEANLKSLGKNTWGRWRYGIRTSVYDDFAVWTVGVYKRGDQIVGGFTNKDPKFGGEFGNRGISSEFYSLYLCLDEANQAYFQFTHRNASKFRIDGLDDAFVNAFKNGREYDRNPFNIPVDNSPEAY